MWKKIRNTHMMHIDMNRKLSQKLYFDYAAATPVRKEVLQKMMPYFSEKYGNPSSIYETGQTARRDIDTARHILAESIGAMPREIIFTSSGTEANNLAIIGFTRSVLKRKSGKIKILTTKIEHSSILEACEYINNGNVEVDYIPLFSDGTIDIEALKAMLTKEVVIISVAHGNNEIGTLQPVQEIGEIIKNFKKKNNTPYPILHIDACQSFGFFDTQVRKMGIDIMSWNSGKIYGPKGAGALYKSENVDIEPLLYGGGQEAGMRSGTENVAAIVGFGEAVRYITREREEYKKHCKKLAKCFTKELSGGLSGWRLAGPQDQEKRLPNNIYILFDDIETEMALVALDRMGVSVSAGAACKKGSSKPSHVLLGIGIPIEKAYRGLRISFGRDTKTSEVKRGAQIIIGAVIQLRKEG